MRAIYRLLFVIAEGLRGAAGVALPLFVAALNSIAAIAGQSRLDPAEALTASTTSILG